LGRDIKV